MDSYDQTTRFRYDPTTEEFCGILEIYVHHARNIHNICIYENQDVYAKFSLTYDPDETFETGIVNGGGKNPEFNEKLVIKINQPDAVLKCEMWMLSRAKSLMEDQLLGFSLVPISLILGNGGLTLTQDFSLSSTDLFHSPAGTVKLSLSLNTNVPYNHTAVVDSSASIASEVVLLDPAEYSRIEFPDINVVKQNHQMVSEYFGLFSSSMTSLSYDRNSADSVDKNNNNLAGESSNSAKGESEMQQQIVDMYMRSMQQFTESLAKMKLPMNLEGQDHNDVVHQPKNKVEVENKKKDGGRVFYGSRAFF